MFLSISFTKFMKTTWPPLVRLSCPEIRLLSQSKIFNKSNQQKEWNIKLNIDNKSAVIWLAHFQLAQSLGHVFLLLFFGSVTDFVIRSCLLSLFWLLLLILAVLLSIIDDDVCPTENWKCGLKVIFVQYLKSVYESLSK